MIYLWVEWEEGCWGVLLRMYLHTLEMEMGGTKWEGDRAGW